MAVETAMKALANGDQPEAVIRDLARQLTNRLMHKPSVKMRQAAYDGNLDILQLIHDVFDLNQSEN